MACFGCLWPGLCPERHRNPLNVENGSEMRTITDARYLAVSLLFELELYVHLAGRCVCDLEHRTGI